MATTTPNFGWPVPTSTDLVKDGATAMEALGDAIDTSMVDLKGGTTGQVLAKASNTDMDFSWVAQDDSNAIQNTIVDAKGDLIAASAADTPARLAVGNNGETLVADSSTSTGLRYTAGTVQSNPVLNSAFQIWQRGTSFTSTAETTANSADRWTAYTGSTGRTVTRQTTNDTTNLPNIQYCLRYQRNPGVTNTNAQYLSNTFETINSIPYAGKTVTLSFYARAGANYSATSNALSVELRSGTGTDQNIYSGFTGTAYVVTSPATLTTTWQRFSFTGTVGATATQLAIALIASPTGTASTNDYFEVTGVQIDIGSVALPFRTYAGTIQGELAACQRYYYRVTNASLEIPLTQLGLAWSTTGLASNIPLPVTMRTAPSAIEYATLAVNDFNGIYSNITNLTLYRTTTASVILSATSGALMTANRVYWITTQNATGNGYIGLTAEL